MDKPRPPVAKYATSGGTPGLLDILRRSWLGHPPALLSIGSRPLTESYRAAPFQGWSVTPLLPVRSTAKSFSPSHPLSGRARTSPLTVVESPHRQLRIRRGFR